MGKRLNVENVVYCSFARGSESVCPPASVLASLPAFPPASLLSLTASHGSSLSPTPTAHPSPTPSPRASCMSHWIDCDVARCSLAQRPQAAFPSVPVNLFWLNTHPHTCGGAACCAQLGNTRMKWFVCGTLHEEDPQPATCLVCPQDSGDASPLPPAPNLAVSGSPGPVTQSPSSPFPVSRTSGSSSTSHRVTCGYSRQASGAMCQGPAGMLCSRLDQEVKGPLHGYHQAR